MNLRDFFPKKLQFDPTPTPLQLCTKEYIIKKHEKVTDNPLIRIYVKKIENWITFKIKTVHYLELLTPETVKLLGSTKTKIIKNKNAENVSHLEITEVLLVHCNIVNNDYQHDLRILHRVFLDKLFGQLLDISPKTSIFFKTLNPEFLYIEVYLVYRSKFLNHM